ncbi:MAG: DMT family transporter [Pseudomonadota bacterium]|jgi:drug/metabolite transporter (DMT)-like permease|nr:hypothetical protein [Alphaproteobacteria bacterium]
MNREIWLGWLAILGAVGIYAGNFVISRYGVKAAIGANDLTALRFGVAGVLMLPLFLRHVESSFRNIGTGRWVILTLLSGPPFTLSMMWGLNFAPVAHGAAIVAGTIPVASSIGARIVFGQKIPLLKLLLFAVIFAGLFLVTGFSAGTGPGVLFGDFLFMLCGAMWGAFAVALRKWTPAPMPLAALTSVLSLLYLPVYFLFLSPDFSAASHEQIAVLALYQGVLVSIVSVVLFSLAVHALGPQKATLGNATVPIFAALIAAPVLGEWPSPTQWLGITLTVGSVILAARIPDAAPVMETEPPA